VSDSKGRLVVVEHAKDELILHRILADGSDGEEVLRRPGGVSSHSIGQPALSGDGARVAFIAEAEVAALSTPPSTIFREGKLEVWGVPDRKRLDIKGQTDLRALERSLAWLPGGKSLIYSALANPKDLPAGWLKAQAASGAEDAGLIPVTNDG